jgi:broad specificity phosphatase PhoE
VRLPQIDCQGIESCRFWDRIVGMAVVYLVQHGEKQGLPGDPGLTAKGRQQATATGRWLRGLGVHALGTSPLRRPRETAECIASVTGLIAQPDARLAERLNWDGSIPLEAFLALWARTRHDRDFAPAHEESSRQAGARLQAFLAGLRGTPGPVAAVTHGAAGTAGRVSGAGRCSAVGCGCEQA